SDQSSTSQSSAPAAPGSTSGGLWSSSTAKQCRSKNSMLVGRALDAASPPMAAPSDFKSANDATNVPRPGGGGGKSRSVASVTTPNVPSEPTNKLVKS